jgi:hypothetical protein
MRNPTATSVAGCVRVANSCPILERTTLGSRVIWTNDNGKRRQQPVWTLTGQLLLWQDGSPAHVRQDAFAFERDAWEAVANVSRSERAGSRWVTVRLRLEPNVQAQWEVAGFNARDRASRQLEAYIRLREWHADDLGTLYLR